MLFRRVLLLSCLLPAIAHAQVALVTAGQPAAVIVTPAQPLPVVSYAAEELAYHLEKATGARLTIVTEDAIPAAPANRVYVGSTKAARAAGCDAGALKREECLLRTAGNSLFIMGEDSDGDPMVQDTRAGTLWGVYELAERLLDARWLWPGELGLSIRATDTVTAPRLDEFIKPRMLQRNVRPGLVNPGSVFPTFSPEGLAKYSQAQRVFLRRHRMGRSMPLKYGHAFIWWPTNGETNPEWFQLVDGKRGPTAPGRTYSMCVSNPDFHQEILRRWRQQKADNPEGPQNVNGTENDIGGLCTCENCMAWDGPELDEGTDIYAGLRYRRVSDRYAEFWKTLYDLAVKEDPDVKVMGYAYINYFPKPSENIRLNPNILVGMCPWPGMWFPRTDREQEWLKEQWAGWAKTGASVFLRPNTTLDGYAMPHNYARQLADEFQHYARNNMVATDFDSLTGQWATQGPTLYLLMRLHVRPERPVNELLKEYYSAFGPAAADVQAYFDYWEDYTTKNRERLEASLSKHGASRYRQYARAVYEAYPPECFVPAQRMLDRAAQKVASQPLYAERVSFVQKGLTHAMLCRDLSAAMGGGDDSVSPMAGRRAIARLAEFRARTEGDFISNLLWISRVEQHSYTLPSGYGGEPLKAASDTVAPLPEDVLPVPVRGQGAFVALLQPGQSFQARLHNRALGRNPDPAPWRLFGPDDKLLQKGEVEVGGETNIDVPVMAQGVYLLEVNSRGNVLRVTMLNDHAATAGERLSLASGATKLHFMVPPGLAQFTLALQSPSPGETALMRVFDPNGQEVAAGDTTEVTERVLKVTVPPAQAGKAWSVTLERAARGAFEDFVLRTGPGLPAFFAHTADRLVVPAP